MIIFKQKEDLQAFVAQQKLLGKKIGFVPTMGALHEGHISLIAAAKVKTDIVVCSIFVNPTQFNNKSDFDKYPNTIESDIDLLETNFCDILYLPSVEDIYETGITQLKHYDLGVIETVYDGPSRPGHFQGVCNVVERLFKATLPDYAFFGLKDYQQCMVIKKLVEIMQWDSKLRLQFCPTLREPSGLAMSSRNMRLTNEQRSTKAPAVYKALNFVKQNLNKTNTTALLQAAKKILQDNALVIDYFDLADAYTLAPVTLCDGKQDLVCVAAVFCGDVRLIDNLVLK